MRIFTRNRLWLSSLLLPLCVWSLGVNSPALATETVYSAAGRQDPLGDIGGGARATVLGSAFVGVADDVSSLFWNPAGLSLLDQPELSASHRNWLGQAFQEVAAFNLPLTGMGTIGFNGQFADYGTFDGRDTLGNPLPGFGGQRFEAGLGWGKKLIGDLAFGLSLHGTLQSLASQSQIVVGADFGALLKTQNGWGFGASFENLGLGASSQNLASSLRMGISRKWKDAEGTSLLAALGGSYESQVGGGIQVGLEGSYRSRIFARAGYDLSFQNSGFTGLQGLTAGAGVVFEPFRVDYAFVPYGDLGSTHLVSLSYSFGGQNLPVPGGPPTSKPSSESLSALTAPPSSAPTTVFVPQAVPTQGQVAPQAVPTAGPENRSERTITMEFDIPAGGEVAKAKTLAQGGQLVEAVKTLKAYLQENPQDASAWDELGNVYFSMGRKDYAVQCFETVLKLRPDEKALSEWLERYKTQKP